MKILSTTVLLVLVLANLSVRRTGPTGAVGAGFFPRAVGRAPSIREDPRRPMYKLDQFNQRILSRREPRPAKRPI